MRGVPIALLCAFVLLASGCGSPEPPSAEATPAGDSGQEQAQAPGVPQLQGEWVLIVMDGEPVDAGTSQPDLTVSAFRANGSGGCNRYAGIVVEVEPGRLKIGPLATTRRACREEVGAFEQRYIERLHQVTGFRREGGELVLEWTDETANGELRYAARKPPETRSE